MLGHTNPVLFKPGDSFSRELFLITHEIYKSFDDGLEVRDVFLDTSKVFCKIWHEVVIFKLNQKLISVDLLKITRDFLSNRKQRVVLNGQIATWTSFNAGVSGGSTYSLFISMIYLIIYHQILNFAVDTSLFSVNHIMNLPAREPNDDL